jgi:hypothetical protein
MNDRNFSFETAFVILSGPTQGSVLGRGGIFEQERFAGMD